MQSALYMHIMQEKHLQAGRKICKKTQGRLYCYWRKPGTGCKPDTSKPESIGQCNQDASVAPPHRFEQAGNNKHCKKNRHLQVKQ